MLVKGQPAIKPLLQEKRKDEQRSYHYTITKTHETMPLVELQSTSLRAKCRGPSTQPALADSSRSRPRVMRMRRACVLMERRPQFVEFLEGPKNDEEECSNRNQEHEVKQQHGVTSEPVVVAGDFDPKYVLAEACSQ